MARFRLSVVLSLGLIALLAGTAESQVVPRSARTQLSPAPTSTGDPMQPVDRQEIAAEHFAISDPSAPINVLTSDRLDSGGLDPSVAARTGTRQIVPSSVVSLGGCPCPGGGLDEGEVCGDADNEGCSAGFCGQGGIIDVSSGDTWCGTAWAEDNTRDLDYYRISIGQISTLTTTMSSAFPSLVFIAEDVAGDCSSFLLLDSYNDDACTGTTHSITLRPGDYYVGLGTGDVDGPIFGGFPCGGGNNQYTIEFDVAPADCLVGAVTELEACGDNTNGGCDPTGVGASSFEPMLAGVPVIGQTSTDAGADLDYYEFDVPVLAEVTITVESEVPTLFAISTNNCVDDGTGVFAEEFICVANVNDGGCSGPTTVTAILSPGSYWFQIGAGDAFGYFIDGVGCADPGNNYSATYTFATPAAPCALTPTGIAEAEACGADVNGGCNLTGVEFEFIPPLGVGSVFDGTGTAWAECSFRDTDWWQFEAIEDFSLTIDLTSQGQMTAWLAPFDCAGLFIIDDVQSVDCVTGSTTLNVAAGEYILLILPADDPFNGIFDDQPCGYRDIYNFSLTAGPVVTGGCPVTCAPTFFEGEACGDMVNDGCLLAPPAFEELGLDPAEIVSGTLFADGTRNFDIYLFDVSQASNVTVTVTSNLPVGVSLVQEACALGGYFPTECDFAFSDGDCVSTTGTTVTTLTAVPPLGNRWALFVTVGGEPFGGCGNVGSAVFSGFPCSTASNEYCLEISTSTPGCFFPTGTVAADCAAGTLDFDLVASSDYTDIDWEAVDQAGNVVGSGTFGAGATSGSIVTESVDISALDAGILDVTVTANCANGDTSVGVAQTGYFPYNGEQHVIVRGDNFDGCIDSAPALEAALGGDVLTIDLLDGDGVGAYDFSTWACGGTLDSSNIIWWLGGTFPNDTAALAAEGQALVDYLTGQSVGVYFEAADAWGFHAPTPFYDYDGVGGQFVDGNVIPDGDDSFTQMIPGVGAVLDVTAFGTVDYGQDNRDPLSFAGNDFTDQLVASDPLGGFTEDEPVGSTAELIWLNSDDGIPFGPGEINYGVAVAYDTEDTFLYGNVISSSFEFGGFTGDQATLASTYANFLAGGPPPPMDLFRRGDSNNDGAVNIADAVYSANALFVPGSPPPPCSDASDTNDDGLFNIADVIYTANFLFIMGSPAPPAPFPDCGVDATDIDMLMCPGFIGTGC